MSYIPNFILRYTCISLLLYYTNRKCLVWCCWKSFHRKALSWDLSSVTFWVLATKLILKKIKLRNFCRFYFNFPMFKNKISNLLLLHENNWKLKIRRNQINDLWRELWAQSMLCHFACIESKMRKLCWQNE